MKKTKALALEILNLTLDAMGDESTMNDIEDYTTQYGWEVPSLDEENALAIVAECDDMEKIKRYNPCAETNIEYACACAIDVLEDVFYPVLNNGGSIEDVINELQ